MRHPLLMLKIYDMSIHRSSITGYPGMNYLFALLFALVLGPVVSCRKTNKLAEQVNDQPFLVTTEFGLDPYGFPTYTYQRNYLVGDTAAFLGKFFTDKAGFQILIGNTAAQIVFKTQVILNPDTSVATNPYTHQIDKLDYVRFVITKSMGTGTNIPVTIAANGTTIKGPSVSIREFQGTKGSMDSTLVVDSLTSWLPADIALYQNNNLPLIMEQSVSREGTLCFNNLTDIFTLRNGTIGRLTGTGSLFQENGVSFTINRILGSVISIAGDSLAFSAEVSENIPDTATSFIFRLCKMDLASGRVRTLNRTLWQKAAATVNAPVAHAQGMAADLPLIAANLKTDLNGSIYFANFFGPLRTDYAASDIYNNGIGIAQSIGNMFPSQVFGNVCRVDISGKLKSLIAEGPYQSFGFAPMYTLPGFLSPFGVNTDYLVSQDGNFGWVCDNLNPASFNPSFAYLDLNLDAPVLSTGYNHYGCNNNSFFLSDFLFLSNGELLYFSSPSLVEINLLNKTSYVYAGVYGPDQVQSTGPAKNVSFTNVNFAGLDKTGAVYYYRGFQDYVNGASFYKLYSKK